MSGSNQHSMRAREAVLRIEGQRHGWDEADLNDFAIIEKALDEFDRLEEQYESREAIIQQQANDVLEQAFQIKELKEQLEAQGKTLERVLYIAEHLFAMVPQKVWRDSGGDDMQGHYEGDYHAEQVRDELVSYRLAMAFSPAREPE